jgi:hypothetical protein
MSRRRKGIFRAIFEGRMRSEPAIFAIFMQPSKAQVVRATFE